jgi:hypothetical protein
MKDHYQPAEQLDDRQFAEVVCWVLGAGTIAIVKGEEGIDQWVLLQCLR